MSDYEIVQDEETYPKANKSEYEIVQDEPHQQQEGFGHSLLAAIPRMGNDLYHSAISGLMNMAHAAPTEVPGLFSTIAQHPHHALQQAGAGIAEMIGNMINTPHRVANYAENRLNLLPQGTASHIPYSHDVEGKVNEALGAPQYPGENLIRGITRDIPGLMLGGKTGAKLNPTKLTNKNIIKDILGTREKNISAYTNKYNNLWQEADERGLGKLTEMPNIDMKTLERYTPEKKIEAIQDLMKNPTAENAHTARSDLLGIKRKLEEYTTHDRGQKRQYSAVNNAIREINEKMFRTKEGYIDPHLAEKYKDISAGYKKEVVPYKNKAISLHRNEKITDDELIAALSKGEFARKRGAYHNIQTREKLGTLAKRTGYAGGIFSLGGAIKNYLLHGKKE